MAIVSESGDYMNIKTNSKVDEYLNNTKQWREEYKELRTIVLDSELTEDFKWGVPCYTIKGKNVVLIHGFKEYCALLFFKGALLHDTHNILIQQTKNVQAARQIRFTNIKEITNMKFIIKSYLNEAIEIEKVGLEVTFKKDDEYIIPEEFQQKLDNNDKLKTAFEALTPGRQRAYLFYFSAPKQLKTKEERIEKYTPQILDGKGLND